LSERMIKMSDCNSNCESCSSNCSDRKSKPDFKVQPHELSSIKKVIGVVSGKGGVGKSLVTSLMAITMNRRGYHSAILDSDITGPSIPKAFGIKEKAQGNEMGLFPVKSNSGIDIMSINLLLDNETDPVVWRGPVIAATVKQFWSDVIWSDVDFMYVDMPPGTGDVPLTVFQSIPLDGIVIVTSPQELVAMIVSKAVGMAKMMNIPVLGIVENMSYVRCPDCGKEISVFGESHAQETAEKFGLEFLAKCPLDPAATALCDAGRADEISAPWLEPVADAVLKLV